MIVKDFIELVKTSPDDPGIPPYPHQAWTESLFSEQLRGCFRGSATDLRQSYRILRFELTFKTRCEGLDPMYLQTLYRMEAALWPPQVVEEGEPISDWRRAVTIARASLASSPPSSERWLDPHDRDGVVCGQAALIQSLGFALTTVDTQVIPIDSRALIRHIESIATDIGGKGIMRQLLREMPIDGQSGRYLFIRRLSNGLTAVDPDLPWNYLYHLAAKLWSCEPQRPNWQRWGELKRVATAYAALANVQNYSIYANLNVDVQRMLRHMYDTAVYDSIFTIDQMQPLHALQLLEGVLHQVDRETRSPDAIPLKSVLTLARHVLLAAEESGGYCEFNATRISAHLNMRRENVINVLNRVLAFGPAEINPNFGEITDFQGANFWSRPLIAESPENYVLVDRMFCSPALLHAVFGFVYRHCLTRDADGKVKNGDGILGTYTEQFLRSIIRESGVPVRNGSFTYAASEDRAKVEGECDVVVETPDTIYFIEVKNKLLTSKARSGEILNLAEDLADGMLHACLQAFERTQLLRQHERMDLKTQDETYRLELRGRRLEAVAMSLSDLGGFQDRVALHQFLRSYILGDVRSDDPKIEARFAAQKKHAGQLRKLVEGLPTEQQEMPFFNCHFMSVPQLMTLLQYVETPGDFDREMRRTRHVTMSTQDWYYEYSRSRERDARASASKRDVAQQ